MSGKWIAILTVCGVLAAVLLGGFWLGFNVLSASWQHPQKPPSAVEQGRANLHQQLQQASAREAEIEKLEWHSVGQLYGIIESHKKRIAALEGNSQAAEIVAHDRAAIDRLEKRIVEIEAQRAAEADRQAEMARQAALQPQPGLIN